jgi:hypothetical protein
MFHDRIFKFEFCCNKLHTLLTFIIVKEKFRCLSWFLTCSIYYRKFGVMELKTLCIHLFQYALHQYFTAVQSQIAVIPQLNPARVIHTECPRRKCINWNMIIQLILNKKCYINMCPIQNNGYRLMCVQSDLIYHLR